MYQKNLRELSKLTKKLKTISTHEAYRYIDELKCRTNDVIESIPEVTVKLNDVFQIVKEENRSTGYSWEAQVTDGLFIDDDHYFENPANGSGKRVWSVKATEKGSQVFKAKYHRDEEKSHDNVYELCINVV